MSQLDRLPDDVLEMLYCFVAPGASEYSKRRTYLVDLPGYNPYCITPLELTSYALSHVGTSHRLWNQHICVILNKNHVRWFHSLLGHPKHMSYVNHLHALWAHLPVLRVLLHLSYSDLIAYRKTLEHILSSFPFLTAFHFSVDCHQAKTVREPSQQLLQRHPEQCVTELTQSFPFCFLKRIYASLPNVFSACRLASEYDSVRPKQQRVVTEPENGGSSHSAVLKSALDALFRVLVTRLTTADCLCVTTENAPAITLFEHHNTSEQWRGLASFTPALLHCVSKTLRYLTLLRLGSLLKSEDGEAKFQTAAARVLYFPSLESVRCDVSGVELLTQLNTLADQVTDFECYLSAGLTSNALVFCNLLKLIGPSKPLRTLALLGRTSADVYSALPLNDSMHQGQPLEIQQLYSFPNLRCLLLTATYEGCLNNPLFSCRPNTRNEEHMFTRFIANLCAPQLEHICVPWCTLNALAFLLAHCRTHTHCLKYIDIQELSISGTCIDELMDHVSDFKEQLMNTTAVIRLGRWVEQSSGANPSFLFEGAGYLQYGKADQPQRQLRCTNCSWDYLRNWAHTTWVPSKENSVLSLSLKTTTQCALNTHSVIKPLITS